MRPAVFVVNSTTTVSPVYVPDAAIAPFSVALGVTVTGTIDYTVEYTFDDVYASGYAPSSGNWVSLTALAAKTASLDAHLQYPVRGIRIKRNSGGTGTDNARLTIIQAGKR